MQGIEILNAAFTPMNGDGSVNFDQIPTLFSHSVKTGSQGVFLNGTTGECMSLGLHERLKLSETWLRHRKETRHENFKIFIHVGGCNLLEAAQMAEHAQDLGADGIAMVSPFYFKPTSVEELVKHCEFVASAAQHTPFYYYNIPTLTGVSFPLNSFINLAIKRIPNFAGLKSSSTEIIDYQNCLHTIDSKYTLYWGIDEAFMMLYSVGNRHYVGSTYNYMSRIYHEMMECYNACDFDKLTALKRNAFEIHRILSEYNGISAGKEVMRFVGIDCGPVRKPLPEMLEVERKQLFQKLMKTVFFNAVT